MIKYLAILLSLLVLCSTADARGRSACANGACAAPVKVFTADLKKQHRAPAGGITILVDGKPQFFKGGQYLPDHYELIPVAPKANQDVACEGDACAGRQPVRRVGKAAGRVPSAPVRAIRRGCRGGRCG